MNILIVTGTYAPETGGIAELIRGFAGGLIAEGVRVQILAAAPGASLFSQPGVPVTEFNLPRLGYLKRVYACRRAMVQAASRWSFERIIASTWSPYAVAAPLRLLGREVFLDVYCHGMDLLEPRRSFRYRLLMEVTLRRAKNVLVVSKFTAAEARKAGARAEKILLVPPGVDPNRFAPGPRNHAILARYALEEDTPILLSVGRLVERKGFDLVIRSLPRVLQKFPKAAYLLAGEGPERSRLEGLARSIGVDSRVRFAGHVPEDEIVRYYQTAGILVMPSRALPAAGDVEGFGIVFLEAACCGIPAIGGRSGGIEDAIVHGETGFLVNPEDPEELAVKILSLLSDADLRRRLGQAGRARAERDFQWPSIARRYLTTVLSERWMK